MSSIGTRIRTMRLSRGWSQAELAKKVGASRSSVTMWETDERRPSLDMFDALADAFNVPIYAIMDDENKQREDEEIWMLRESMRRNPGMRILFNSAKDATPKQLKQAAAILDALKASDGNV